MNPAAVTADSAAKTNIIFRMFPPFNLLNTEWPPVSRTNRSVSPAGAICSRVGSAAMSLSYRRRSHRTSPKLMSVGRLRSWSERLAVDLTWPAGCPLEHQPVGTRIGPPKADRSRRCQPTMDWTRLESDEKHCPRHQGTAGTTVWV